MYKENKLQRRIRAVAVSAIFGCYSISLCYRNWFLIWFLLGTVILYTYVIFWIYWRCRQRWQHDLYMRQPRQINRIQEENYLRAVQAIKRIGGSDEDDDVDYDNVDMFKKKT